MIFIINVILAIITNDRVDEINKLTLLAEKSFLEKNYKEEPLVGIMKYPNEYLSSKGIKKGDRVIFKPDSEYEFEVDGEKLYRMYDHQITVVL